MFCLPNHSLLLFPVWVPFSEQVEFCLNLLKRYPDHCIFVYYKASGHERKYKWQRHYNPDIYTFAQKKKHYDERDIPSQPIATSQKHHQNIQCHLANYDKTNVHEAIFISKNRFQVPLSPKYRAPIFQHLYWVHCQSSNSLHSNHRLPTVTFSTSIELLVFFFMDCAILVNLPGLSSPMHYLLCLCKSLQCTKEVVVIHIQTSPFHWLKYQLTGSPVPRGIHSHGTRTLNIADKSYKTTIYIYTQQWYCWPQFKQKSMWPMVLTLVHYSCPTMRIEH